MISNFSILPVDTVGMRPAPVPIASLPSDRRLALSRALRDVARAILDADPQAPGCTLHALLAQPDTGPAALYRRALRRALSVWHLPGT